MERLMRTAGVFAGFLVLLASCGPAKAPEPALPLPAPVAEPGAAFPVPYYPVMTPGLYGWTAAGVYAKEQLDDRQKALVAQLEPAGGEGEVGLGFTRDFDGDGLTETVSYGAYKTEKDEGNFVLVVRDNPEVVLLKQEIPGPPRFTVFTLKPDGSLWFGGGIDAGEVTMNLTWEAGKPVFHRLTGD